MKTKTFLTILLTLTITFLSAQDTITSGRLSLTFENVVDGVELTSIKDNGTELLNTGGNSYLFLFTIRNTTNNLEETMTAEDGWTNVSITNLGDSALIVLSDPISNQLPNTLTATMLITTNNEKSSWDLAITGLGNCSLMNVTVPQLNIIAGGDDYFLAPYYHGQLTHNPGTDLDYYDDAADPNDNRIGLYPRGWGATMQFMSYYNDDRALYFGFHDPTAALKQMQARDESGGVEVVCRYYNPDMTLAGNDWQLPGVFQLDLFDGDWYDASIHYKDWVSVNADYYPQHSTVRDARQSVLGGISLWIYNYLSDMSGNLNSHQGLIHEVANFVETPLGVHWYKWNYLDMDDDYPVYFPERSGLDTLVMNTQGATDDIFIMPYINGRMFDEDLTCYNTDGLPYATKREDGSVYEQVFNGNTFAVMCPTQTSWQDTLIYAANRLSENIGTAGVYIDQVGCAAPAQCMDTSHHHPLGGGSYWSDGYQEMFLRIHNNQSTGKFITTEGGCDFLANEVDGFMIQGWQSTNLVPSFSAVYSGEVQLFGTLTGTSQYGNQRFYVKLANAFTYGVQTGRQSMWLYLNLANANDDKMMAANYTKSLGKMRFKLKDYMSFGQMQRPLTLSGTIPTIIDTVNDAGVKKAVSYSAIQSSVWKNGDSLILLFANARIQNPAGTSGGNIDFTFTFDGSEYGLDGNLTIQEIRPTADSAILQQSNAFTMTYGLKNLEKVAFKIKKSNRIMWTGTNSTDWADSGNWDAGLLPTILSEITIPTTPTGGNFPETNSGASALCNTLNIETGAHLWIPSNNTLSVNSDLTNNAGMSGLVVRADATGSGSLLHSVANIEGKVESYISEDEWHLISTPINNALAGVYMDFFLYEFDETDYTWHYITNINTDLTEGLGYYIWSKSASTGSTTVEYSGILNNGDILVNGLSYTATQPSDKRGWNMIGNPYPSATQWNDNWTRNNVDPVAYIYDGANYITWNAATQTGTHPNGDLAPGQGFWVKANASSASVTIPQSERKHSTQQFYKNTIENQILMTLNGNNLEDKALILFDNKATAEFDSQYDAWKIKGDPQAPQLYSIFGDDGMTVNALPMQENMIIPLGVEAGKSGSYTLFFNDFEISTELSLEDLQTSKTFKISPDFEYHFVANSGDEVHRFNLHFENTLSIEEDDISKINIYSLNSKIYIQSTDILDGEIEILNMVGQKVLSTKLFGKDYYSIPVRLSEGVYIISLRTNKNIFSHKLFIK